MAYHEQVRFFPGMQACFDIQRLVSVNCISSYCCYNKLPQTYWLKNNISRLRIFKSLSLSLFIITTPSLTLILLCFAVLNCSAVSDSLQSYGLWPARLLCPWGFFRQEYCSGLPCPPPGDFPNPGIKPTSLRSPALVAGFFTIEPAGSLSEACPNAPVVNEEPGAPFTFLNSRFRV